MVDGARLEALVLGKETYRPFDHWSIDFGPWGYLLLLWVFADRILIDILATVGVPLVFSGASSTPKHLTHSDGEPGTGGNAPTATWLDLLVRLGIPLQIALTVIRLFLLWESFDAAEPPTFTHGLTTEQLEVAGYRALSTIRLGASLLARMDDPAPTRHTPGNPRLRAAIVVLRRASR